MGISTPRVASFTDAWIETFGEALGNFGMESHLLQMRGLKLTEALFLMLVCRVASFTDAWIETPKAVRMACPAEVASFTDAWIET